MKSVRLTFEPPLVNIFPQRNAKVYRFSTVASLKVFNALKSATTPLSRISICHLSFLHVIPVFPFPPLLSCPLLVSGGTDSSRSCNRSVIRKCFLFPGAATAYLSSCDFYWLSNFAIHHLAFPFRC